MKDHRPRGPLWAIILTATGEDVRGCRQCFSCEEFMQPEMDFSFGEVFQLVAHDDPKALTNQTLWNCDTLLEKGIHCQNGLDLSAVVTALRDEARLRGVEPEARQQSKRGD